MARDCKDERAAIDKTWGGKPQRSLCSRQVRPVKLFKLLKNDTFLEHGKYENSLHFTYRWYYIDAIKNYSLRSREAQSLRDPKLNGKGVQQAVDLRYRLSSFLRLRHCCFHSICLDINSSNT